MRLNLNAIDQIEQLRVWCVYSISYVIQNISMLFAIVELVTVRDSWIGEWPFINDTNYCKLTFL